MLKYAYDGVIVKVENEGYIPEEEAKAYVDRARELYGSKVTEVIVKIDKDDPDMADLEYKWNGEQFHRLRRITGYLVGNLSRWNNGKRAEERDRVKHG
jgi:anaerobic ribonucleoside-triphosphate reductase